MICSCNIFRVRDCNYIASLGGFIVSSFDLFRVRPQRITAGRRSGRFCDYFNLFLFRVSQIRIFFDIVIQICNQVVRSLTGPDTEGNHISHLILKLEAFTHIPMHRAIILIVAGSGTAILFTGVPFLHVGCSSVFIIFSAVAIVSKAVGINLLHDLHFGTGHGGDTISNFHITKAQLSFDRLGDGFKSLFHRRIIRGEESVTCIIATLRRQILNFGNTI